MTLVAAALFAYLIGSISFAVLVSRAYGLPDPHTYGSGNPGATNVLRTGRKAAAALTLVGDGFKGWLAVALAQQHAVGEPLAVAVAAVAVIVGHMWPVFFRFEGGKGVSTALGVLIALDYRIAALAVVSWVVMAVFFRVSSLAGMTAAVGAAFMGYLLYGWHPITGGLAAICALILWRHRSNIRNLIAGSEGRIGKRAR